MRYFGGKSRIAAKLVEFMQPHIDARGIYVEPFVGGANVMCRIQAAERRGYDANHALVTMYQALADGWIPPNNITEDQYAELKKEQNANNPATAFAGFGCSFAGKWFGGYARDNRGTNYATDAKNSLMRKAASLGYVMWASGDYRDMYYPENAVVYCDPPYQGTTQYGAVGNFDSAVFWDFCRGLTTRGNAVFISEYAAPEDFIDLLNIHMRVETRNSKGERPTRVEKLFVHKDFLNDTSTFL